MKRLTTEELILKARKVHGNKYDYSKVEYRGAKNKICIICPKHGEFWQSPSDHIYKLANCPECGSINRSNKQKSTTKEFIEKARKVHGDKYDYSKVNYTTARTKIEIICPEHGPFILIPNNHLNGEGCPYCGDKIKIKKQTSTLDEFIQKASIKHNNKYDYSLTKYKNSKEKITIICPIHGEFEQIANNHIRGAGCPECAKEKVTKLNTKSTEDFIKEANDVHDYYYNYLRCKYTGCFDKVTITCPIHGDFKQRAYAHLNGLGCPKCSKSKGEKLIEDYLIDNNIKYISQYEIPIDISINSSGFAYIDFYLPNKNTFIEYNGILHYKYIPYLHKGGIVDFEKQIERDNYVRTYCKDRLIEFSYKDNKENILKCLNELTKY